ncbi:hypothetical protein GCM10009759_60580 [Kitasatospora saccharophila]|uniref:RES domain-containing protein n=1 Tax=Kitasatospora saccharophila TaxID=407973 RepID=A0ABP5JHS9_9ACTN
MPDVMVPGPTVRATPHRELLPAGTALWRLHSAAYPPAAFNPRPADMHWGGGRFCSFTGDGTELPYLYAGFTERTALLETLVRGIEFDDAGWRRIVRKAVAGKVLSRLETTCDIPLVGLRTPEQLAAVHQDEWLVHAPAADYGHTRRWAAWIRAQAPWAQGLAWMSKRDTTAAACVLYERPGSAALVKPSGTEPVELDTAAGAELLNRLLAPCRVRIEPPRRRS